MNQLNLRNSRCLETTGRFNMPFATKDVSPGGTASMPQRHKFHTDDVNQCLHNKTGSYGVPNVNLFDFMFLLVENG